MPGEYTVRLIADGKTLTEPLKVVMDPRVKTPMADLEQQFTVAKRMYDDVMKATAAMHEISVLREQLKARRGSAGGGAGGPDHRFEAGCDCGAGAWRTRIWARASGTGNAGFGADATGAAGCTRLNLRMKHRRQLRARPSVLRRSRWMG